MIEPQKPLTADEIADLKAKAKAAYPGEWKFDLQEPKDVKLKRRHWRVGIPGDKGIALVFGDTDPPQSNNAAYIAAANPATVLRLIATTEQQREQIEKLRAILQDIAAWLDRAKEKRDDNELRKLCMDG